jgi:type II secretory pathway pseudopilin PulG
MTRQSRRRAFTLFHLLVLLAILALLFAMLLPAVARIREEAAKSQSMNNMRQLALGCHAYHDANAAFPPGVDSNHFSAATRLLPFIEQDNLYKLLDLTKPCDDKANATIRKTFVKTFMNPLDLAPAPDMDSAYTNYLFNAGSKYDLADNNGVFFLNSSIKIAQVSDGLSNTMMIGETLRGDGMVRAVSVMRQHVALKKADLKDLTDDSGVADFKDDKHIAANRCSAWIDGRFLQGTFTTTRALNDEKPDVDCDGAGGLSGPRGVRNVSAIALCDGSARRVTDKIKLDVWKALGTRDGGEVIPDF